MKGDAAATTASTPETPIALKKNHALHDIKKYLETIKKTRGKVEINVQTLDDPLHYPKL